MRIALLAPFGLRAKGTARARTLPLARALVRHGHTAAVFIPPYDSTEDAGQRWIDEGVEVINVSLPPGGQNVLWYWQLGWRQYQAALQWRPHVVHAFKPKGPSGLAATLIWARRREARPRLVVDSDDWEGPGGWNDNPAVGYSAGQKRFFAWQERFGLSHADAWTVTSQCLAERAIAFGAGAEAVHVLHNGVEIRSSAAESKMSPPDAAVYPAHEGPGSIPPSVVLYTRFAGTRPDAVEAIWRRVRELESGAVLAIIGRGVLGEERRLSLLPGVEVKGWLSTEEIRAALERAALAIAPWENTAANRARHSAKILELMASGLPVVASRVGEMLATLGDTGVLVAPSDVEGFARAIVDLLHDRPRRLELGVAAGRRVRERFNWDLLAGVALAAYGAQSHRL